MQRRDRRFWPLSADEVGQLLDVGSWMSEFFWKSAGGMRDEGRRMGLLRYFEHIEEMIETDNDSVYRASRIIDGPSKALGICRVMILTVILEIR